MAKFRKFKTDFAQVPNSVLQEGKLSFKARGLWAYLQSLPEHWDCSVERIAEGGQDGDSSVRCGIKELEEVGYLTRKQIPLSTGGTTTEYQLIIPTRDVENRGLGNQRVDIGITNTQITTKKTQSCAFPSESTIDSDFEAFWELYPKGRKKKKRTAFMAFKSACNRAEVKDIADGYKKFLLDCQGKETRFIPLPTTWLNGDGWGDDYEEPQKATNYGF